MFLSLQVRHYHDGSPDRGCDAISFHPAIAMHFELFNDKAAYTDTGPITDISVLRQRDLDPTAFFCSKVNESEKSRVGFKMFPEHAHDMDFLERLLADRRVKKVVLRRENRLALCTSVMRTAVTGHYIHKTIDHVPVHIKPHELESFIEGYDKYYAFLRERLADQHFVEISYEELVAEPKTTLTPVLRLLGLESEQDEHPGSRDIQPQSSGELRHAVVNFEELRAAFLGTERAPDFD
eukprot:2632927-Rhodomonas_salina.2